MNKTIQFRVYEQNVRIDPSQIKYIEILGRFFDGFARVIFKLSVIFNLFVLLILFYYLMFSILLFLISLFCLYYFII